jgi:hypothetical protein
MTYGVSPQPAQSSPGNAAEGSDNMAEGFRNILTGFGRPLTHRKGSAEAQRGLPKGPLCCLSWSDNMAESSAMFVTLS